MLLLLPHVFPEPNQTSPVINSDVVIAVVVAIIRPHRSTMYVDAACCYRPSNEVSWLVCLSVTIVCPAKTAEPIEMSGLRSWIGPRNHVLNGCPDPFMGRGIFGEWVPIVKFRDTLW